MSMKIKSKIFNKTLKWVGLKTYIFVKEGPNEQENWFSISIPLWKATFVCCMTFVMYSNATAHFFLLFSIPYIFYKNFYVNISCVSNTDPYIPTTVQTEENKHKSPCFIYISIFLLFVSIYEPCYIYRRTIHILHNHFVTRLKSVRTLHIHTHTRTALW